MEFDLLGRATAARSMAELRAEIATLGRLERLADGVLRGGEDAKWQELAGLLDEIFTLGGQVFDVLAGFTSKASRCGSCSSRQCSTACAPTCGPT